MLSDQTVEAFLDELASAEPVPGGGGAAAAVGAMGAALVSMVCNLTRGKKKFAAVESQMQVTLTKSETLRAKLTEMIEADAAAFNSVMAAYSLPRETPEEKEARCAAIEVGSKQATLVPLAVARACAEVIDLCQLVAELGNPNVVSDAGGAVLCAQAGLKSAALNVLINLGAIQDEAFVSENRAELEQIMTGHEMLANEIYAVVKKKL